MKGLPKPLTPNQAETLIALEDKYTNQKITEKQLETLVDLRKKQKAKPVLSEGAKTYLKSIFKEEVFGRKKEVQNKYLSKGIAVEEDNINMYNDVNGTFLIKNEVRYENEFFTGEMDIEEEDEIIDFKSSWDYSTFPLFEDDVPNEDYEYQLLAYMDLRPNVKSAKLVYGLVDTPNELILDEKKRIGWKLGLIDGLPKDLDEEITRNMTYADIPKEARIKKFIIYRDEKRIAQIKAMILLAREYLNSLNTTLAKHLQLI
ncbi:hypothetical protein [Chryseobacterium artocarpi]|uniref:hypothetical protein n=1 Tax=Chryseobacterium artocarpi TaxID=1414727 RepID=UPI003F310324